jgi:glycosyltransferase involved in cell wall biosynthesis
VPRPRLQIVVPCFNEAKRLDMDAFDNHKVAHPDHAFVFVDDGSTDGTADVIRARGYPLVVLERNMGKAEAVRRGVLEALKAEPDIFGYWDADLATPLPALVDFMRVFGDRPAVQILLGARVRVLGHQVRRNPGRHYMGRVFATLASRILRLEVYDTQCGAKLFKNTDRTAALFDKPFKSRWIFDVELLSRFNAALDPGEDYELRVNELPLRAWVDVAGSKLRARDGLRALWDLMRLWLAR